MSTALSIHRPDAPPDAAAAAHDDASAARSRGLSPETRRLYAGAWQVFVAWGLAAGEPIVLPVPPERIVAYIESLPTRIGRNGLKLRLAAIADAHRQQGATWQDGHAALRAALRRRQLPAPDLALADQLASCGEDLAGLRDRLLLLLMSQVGGLAPADIAGVDRGDLRFEDAALVVHVRASQAAADEPGQAVRLSRRRGDPLCPVAAIERWLQRSAIRYGAVFRAINRHGTLERRLGVVGIRRILQRIDKQAAAQATPPPRKLVRGAWRKPMKAKPLAGRRAARPPVQQHRPATNAARPSRRSGVS